MSFVNHRETLELGALEYLAGMVWSRCWQQQAEYGGTQAKGQRYTWMQGLEKLLVISRSGNTPWGNGRDTWCELPVW